MQSGDDGTELKGSCHCGGATWRFTGMPESVTACNCTLCRRMGTLWIYDYEGERITFAGPTTAYARRDIEPGLEIRFCPTCSNVVCWRSLKVENGKRRIAVNLRLADPAPVAHLPIDHFDGLDTWTDLPGDGRCVKDLWF